MQVHEADRSPFWAIEEQPAAPAHARWRWEILDEGAYAGGGIAPTHSAAVDAVRQALAEYWG